MIAVVQRVSEARVEVAGEIVGQIGHGLLVLMAVETDDTVKEAQWIARKLSNLRIFPKDDKAYDLTVREVGGSILMVSNFTVSADTSEGRRPSLSGAAPPALAQRLFDQVVFLLRKYEMCDVATGQFGAMMKVSLVNEGPSTFIVKSEKKSGD
jgi:D-tyrosyl-tRNA(Tyr) deacylase